MSEYGLWKEQVEIDGEMFGADLVEQRYADGAGVKRILALNGLPARFERDLIRSAQVSDVPHTWRVQECSSPEEVTDEILQRGKQALDKDRREYHAYIFTYLGDRDGSGRNLEFLAAGAVRDKLTRDYENPLYPVVSRAIVAPAHRGKHLGTLIVEHRWKALLHYFGRTPRAIHFGTESKKVLQSIKKVERDLGWTLVYIGDEQYTSSDGTHTVHDFLVFLPQYQTLLLDACRRLGKRSGEAAPFAQCLEAFMQRGIEGCTGKELEARFHALSESLAGVSEARPDLELLAEVFLVKKKIGAEDPQKSE